MLYFNESTITENIKTDNFSHKQYPKMISIYKTNFYKKYEAQLNVFFRDYKKNYDSVKLHNFSSTFVTIVLFFAIVTNSAVHQVIPEFA